MASAKSPEDSALKRIDEALSLWNDDLTHSIPRVATPISKSHQQMLDKYISEKKPQHCSSVHLPFESLNELYPGTVEQNEVLEAALFSKVFDSWAEYDVGREQYKDESLWVRNVGVMSPHQPYDAILIRQGEIIHHLHGYRLVGIRRGVKAVYDFLKTKIRANLVEAFASPECGQPDKVSQPPQAAAACSAPSAPPINNSDPVKHPMTEEMKAIMLDELETLRLDARVKQQFAFDLKVLPDKGVLYWRDRLDCLRLAAASSPESQESQRLSEMASLEKMMTGEKPAETVLEEQASLLKSMGEVKADGEKLQKLVGTVDAKVRVSEEKLQTLVDAVNPMKAMTEGNKEVLQQLVDTVVHEVAVNEQQLLKLVKSMDEKIKVNGEKLETLVAAVDERLAIRGGSRQQLLDPVSAEKVIEDHEARLAKFDKYDPKEGTFNINYQLWCLYDDLIHRYREYSENEENSAVGNRFLRVLDELYLLNKEVRLLQNQE